MQQRRCKVRRTIVQAKQAKTVRCDVLAVAYISEGKVQRCEEREIWWLGVLRAVCWEVAV